MLEAESGIGVAEDGRTPGLNIANRTPGKKLKSCSDNPEYDTIGGSFEAVDKRVEAIGPRTVRIELWKHARNPRRSASGS